MAMAHSVEGRFPFLDHRVIEFASQLPPKLRMRALNEKFLLKKTMAGALPSSVLKRTKQPYMAPDIPCFFHDGEPDYLERYLSETAITDAGIFNPKMVGRLLDKCRKSSRQGFRENMAFIGILSTQILYSTFIKEFHQPLDTGVTLRTKRRIDRNAAS
jgi:asparagine synthase (glutamine-hydrolysing)